MVMVSPRSWQVSRAAFVTPALALTLVAFVLSAAEIVARLPSVRDWLHPPSVGSTSRRFELQLDGLGRYAAAGRPDCIVIGNSTVLLGVDPSALSAAYRARTGRDLRCFSFGVAGMSASAVGAIAPILLDDYRPWLLIYVSSVRDVGQSVDGPLLASMPWVRYRRGDLSVDGWLTEHSAAFRYYLLYRQWLDPSRWPAARSRGATTAAGFLRAERRLPLSEALWARVQRAYTETTRQSPSQTELEGFSRLLDLRSSATQIVVVEAPAHERLRRWARHTSAFYGDAIGRMRQAARRRRIPFWRVAAWRVIPTDGWTDFVHLNGPGAARFSEWMGTRLAAAVREGRIKVPSAAPEKGR
jgi:hypothetical protein